jgi:hypothetical protein
MDGIWTITVAVNTVVQAFPEYLKINLVIGEIGTNASGSDLLDEGYSSFSRLKELDDRLISDPKKGLQTRNPFK